MRHAIRDEKSIYDSKKEKSFKNTHKLYENSYKKIFSNEKSMYDSKKEKSFENTHKLHKNSKT